MTTHDHNDAADTEDAEFEREEREKEEKAERAKAEFASMLDDSLKTKKKRFSLGDKVRGELLVIGKETAYASIGAQSDGVIQRRDLLDKEGNLKYKVGDTVEFFVVQVKGGEIHLSTNPTAKNLAEGLEDAFRMRVAIEGRVSEVVNGGFRVLIQGKPAFCPISQMDSYRIEAPEEYVGKKFEFMISQITEGGRNVIVSRRKLLDAQKTVSEGSFLAEHQAGAVVNGKVKRLEKFGAFIEVAPGIEGMAHISELAWSRVGDPSEVLTVGQEMPVKILKIEKVEGRTRIALSIKQAGAEPWDALPPRIAAGEMAQGRVTRLAKFGAFVELVPGVEGLIPLSEMSYTKRVMRAEEVVKEGETVTVMIKEVDRGAKRVSLSLKDAGSDPWAMVPIKFPVGTLVTGTVERREAFGLFIKLDDGIVGLLPKSKALENSEFPFDKLKPGDKTSVMVMEVRPEERRISLTTPKDPSVEDWKSYKPAASGSFGTLADKLKSAMDKKKK